MAYDFTSADRDNLSIAGIFSSPAIVSISAWVDLDSFDTGGTVHVVSLGDSVVISLVKSGEEAQGFFYQGSSVWNTITTSGFNFLTSGWAQVGYVTDPGNSRQELYVNGVSSATGTDADAIDYTLGANTLIGINGNAGTATDVDGRIAEVGIWNIALSDEEMAGLGKGISPAYYMNGLVWCRSLIRGTGGPFQVGVAPTANGVSVFDHVPGIIYPS